MNAELLETILVNLNLGVMISLLLVGTTMGVLIAREVFKALISFTLHRKA